MFLLASVTKMFNYQPGPGQHGFPSTGLAFPCGISCHHNCFPAKLQLWPASSTLSESLMSLTCVPCHELSPWGRDFSSFCPSLSPSPSFPPDPSGCCITVERLFAPRTLCCRLTPQDPWHPQCHIIACLPSFLVRLYSNIVEITRFTVYFSTNRV